MPFLDDSGPRPEEERSPIRRSFALIKDQIERLIVINLLWALQCAPLLVAWAVSMPDWLRVLLTLYSVIALIPATGLLFTLTGQLSQGIPLDREEVLETLRQTWKASLLKLLPLYSMFAWLGWGVYARRAARLAAAGYAGAVADFATAGGIAVLGRPLRPARRVGLHRYPA